MAAPPRYGDLPAYPLDRASREPPAGRTQDGSPHLDHNPLGPSRTNSLLHSRLQSAEPLAHVRRELIHTLAREGGDAKDPLSYLPFETPKIPLPGLEVDLV